MLKINKMTKRVWTKKDLKELKSLVRDGKSNTEIGSILGRTPAAVAYRKFAVKSDVDVKKVKVKVKEKVKESVDVKDSAKEMTRLVRQIARANGQRITMAMFFVENI